MQINLTKGINDIIPLPEDVNDYHSRKVLMFLMPVGNGKVSIQMAKWIPANNCYMLGGTVKIKPEQTISLVDYDFPKDGAFWDIIEF